MEDDTRTIAEAKEIVRRFCEERDWDQFHNPKDLSVGMVTEASELLELFRFKTPEECKVLLSDPKKLEDVKDELSDVFYFVLRFAQMNGIDLFSALESKIEKNDAKYPADKVRGCNRKYDEY